MVEQINKIIIYVDNSFYMALRNYNLFIFKKNILSLTLLTLHYGIIYVQIIYNCI